MIERKLIEIEYNGKEDPILLWGWTSYNSVCVARMQEFPTRMGFARPMAGIFV